MIHIFEKTILLFLCFCQKLFFDTPKITLNVMFSDGQEKQTPQSFSDCRRDLHKHRRNMRFTQIDRYPNQTQNPDIYR